MINVGDRVAQMDSYYVGTVTEAFATCCVVEYDCHGRYTTRKRKELNIYTGLGGVQLAKPYQEFHNACGMMKDGVPTCVPQNPYLASSTSKSE